MSCDVVVLLSAQSVELLWHLCFFFFKQKTAYEMRISDWSSDVCSSDLQSRCAARSVAAIGPVGLKDGIARTPDAARVDGERRQVQRPAARFEQRVAAERSEVRRVGKEWVSTWKSRGSPYN